MSTVTKFVVGASKTGYSNIRGFFAMRWYHYAIILYLIIAPAMTAKPEGLYAFAGTVTGAFVFVRLFVYVWRKTAQWWAARGS